VVLSIPSPGQNIWYVAGFPLLINTDYGLVDTFPVIGDVDERRAEVLEAERKDQRLATRQANAKREPRDVLAQHFVRAARRVGFDDQTADEHAAAT